MTSQASSTKRKGNNPFRINFSNTMKENLGYPAIIFGLLSLVYPILSFISIKNVIKFNIMENTKYDIAKKYKYILTN